MFISGKSFSKVLVACIFEFELILLDLYVHVKKLLKDPVWCLPLITYAPRGRRGGGQDPYTFPYLLHATRWEGVQPGVQIACKIAYVLNGTPISELK